MSCYTTTLIEPWNFHVQELANLPTLELFQNDGSPSARKLFILWNPILRPKDVSWNSFCEVIYSSYSVNWRHICTTLMLLLPYCRSWRKLSLQLVIMSWQMKVLILFVQGDNPCIYGLQYYKTLELLTLMYAALF